MSDLTNETGITSRVTGNETDTGTRSANDPSSQVHTTATVPNSYPVQPYAGVLVTWGVIAKVNSPGTSTISDAIFCDTDLTNYVVDVPRVAQDVYSLWQSFANATTATPAGLGANVEIHWSIKLANPTAPQPSMGSWVQAKQHYDGHLSWGNVTSVQDIITPIMNNIPYMAKIAKYS